MATIAATTMISRITPSITALIPRNAAALVLRLLLAAGGLLGQLARLVVGERLRLADPADVPALDVAAYNLELAHGRNPTRLKAP